MELYDLLPESAAAAERSEPPSATSSGARTRFATIPIHAVSSAPASAPRFPHWLPVLDRLSDLPAGTARELPADGEPILLCRRGDELFALDAHCARDGSSLRGATLSGYTLTCPQHAGCHYDVRQGAPVGGGHGIECYPVRVDDNGRVLIGLDMDFAPRLPAL